ncbi:MAG: hypothetical protein J1G05_00155 [Clostridiales bacterium]|nr:hypothetical protein [Clostridiales bacterium]
MTIIQLINTFTLYGIDTVLLAALTTVTVAIIKKLFFKKASKKLLTFLPFIIGTIFYCAYSAVTNFSFAPVINGISAHLEKGFAVGATSTILYVIYEQFVRGDKSTPLSESVAKAILEGYIKSDELSNASKSAYEAIVNDVTGSALERVRHIISEHADEGTDEREILMLAKTLCDTLAHLNSASKTN